MRHAGTQEIETPRLLLRRLMPSDAPMMYSNWANDPEVTRWLRWTPHKDVAETQELLSAWALLYPNEDYYQWAIVEKATGQVFGSISYLSSESGYRAVLYVYNSQQALIYRWLSSSQYFMRCTVSSGAKYAAAAALGQEDGMFQSSVVLFRTDSEEILRTIPIGNALIYDLHFLPGNTLCVLCEDALYFYELDGQCLGSYAFEDAYLKDYTLDGNGFVTLVMNLYKAGNGYTALTVGYDGTVLGTLPISEQILDISASGKYLALLTSGALSIYDQNLTEYDVSDNTTGASSAVMREDGSAILLANGHGTLYVP